MDQLAVRVRAAVVTVSALVLLAGLTEANVPSRVESWAVVGGFEVQALVEGAWEHVGNLHFDRFERGVSLQLPAGVTGGDEVRVRLTQHGGGAAFIDAVRLDDRPAIAVDGLAERAAGALIAARDLDLADATGRTIELAFRGGSGPGELHIVARVDEAQPHGSPFSFPLDNLFRPVSAESAFYRYRPVAGAKPPQWPVGLDSEPPIFEVWCEPTSGHPDGTTYGWVANDDSTLYVAVDFTPDNTRDGGADWLAVWVNVNDVPREFRVSEGDTRWGRPSFVTTSRAAYRHKLYTFEIPFEELGIEKVADAGPLDLAFEAYGTVAIAFDVSPSLWDFGPILVGDAAPLRTFTVTASPGGMTLGTPWFTRNGPDSGSFPLTPGTCSDGLKLASGETCTFQVGFTPGAVGPFQDGVVVWGQVVGGPTYQVPVSVLGQGAEPIPAVSARTIALLVLLLLAAGVLALRRFW